MLKHAAQSDPIPPPGCPCWGIEPTPSLTTCRHSPDMSLLLTAPPSKTVLEQAVLPAAGILPRSQSHSCAWLLSAVRAPALLPQLTVGMLQQLARL